MDYRREIDGLRGIAVLSVILFHAKVPPFSGGYVGVDVFFVISGYLITGLLLKEHAANGKISYPNFVARRARRILPALLAVIVVSALVAWYLMTPYQLRDFAQSVVATLLFASNILFYIESGYFAPAAELKPLLHTWSLAIEEQYYLVFPLLTALCLRKNLRTLFLLTIALAIVGAVLAIVTTPDYPVAAFFLTPMRAVGILLGALVAISMHSNAPVSPGKYDTLIATAGFAMLIVSIFAFNEFSAYPGYNVLLPVVGTALLIRFIQKDTIIYTMLSHQYMIALGLISFSLYLWHQPALVFARMITFDHLTPLSSALAMLVTFILSVLSWKFVEQPFRKKNVIGTPIFVATMVTLTASLFVFSFYAISVRGDLGRYSDQSLADLKALSLENVARQKSVRADICHYNNRTGIGLDNYLKQYNCIAPDEAVSGHPRIIVAGDSHSADLAVALLENDIPITQLGGAGCALDPANMTPECRTMFDTLLPQVADQFQPDILIIANRYEGNELGKAAAARTWDYWGSYAPTLMIFTEAVELPIYDQAIATGKVLSAAGYKPPYTNARNAYFAELESRGAVIADRKAAFCNITEECTNVDETGELLMVDPDHLSPLGARKFGEQVLKMYPQLRAAN